MTRRRITATQYVEWVLGTTHAASLPYIIPEYDPARTACWPRNPYNLEFGEAGGLSDRQQADPRPDRRPDRVPGARRHAGFPAALHRIGLETRITPGKTPARRCSCTSICCPAASEEIYFLLGQGQDREHALALAGEIPRPGLCRRRLGAHRRILGRPAGTVQVHTPDPATDLMLNRWLLYQALSCRIWGRSAFYQSSGAFGFRDQLQDVLACCPSTRTSPADRS